MTISPFTAFRVVGLNALLGVGLFVPLIALLEEEGSASRSLLGLLAGTFPLVEGVAGLLYPRLLRVTTARALLVTGQLLCGASCLALLFREESTLLFVSRILGGLGGASVVVAQHAIGQMTEGTERVRRLGQVGATMSGGFVVGLTLMAVLGGALKPELSVPVAAVAGALFGLGGALVVMRSQWNVTESSAAAASDDEALPLPYLALYALNTVVYIGLSVAASIWAGTVPAIGVTGIGMIFAALAIVSMFVQSRVASYASARIGHTSAILLGFAICSLGAALFAAHASVLAKVTGLVVTRLGYAIIVPTTLARILGGSSSRSRTRAGLSMVAASVGSWFGPLLVGVLSQELSLDWAGGGLAAVAVTGAIVAFFVHQGGRSSQPARIAATAAGADFGRK